MIRFLFFLHAYEKKRNSLRVLTQEHRDQPPGAHVGYYSQQPCPRAPGYCPRLTANTATVFLVKIVKTITVGSSLNLFVHHTIEALLTPYHTVFLSHLTSPPSVLWSLFLQSVISVAQSCLTLCDPMNHSTPGLPVHYQLPEFTQTHVHRVGDAIQPSHPLSSPSPPAPNPSQHQGLFRRVNSSHEVAEILEFQLQHQSFQWTPRTDLL